MVTFWTISKCLFSSSLDLKPFQSCVKFCCLALFTQLSNYLASAIPALGVLLLLKAPHLVLGLGAVMLAESGFQGLMPAMPRADLLQPFHSELFTPIKSTSKTFSAAFSFSRRILLGRLETGPGGGTRSGWRAEH